MRAQPDLQRVLLRPRIALPSWVEQDQAKASKDPLRVPSQESVLEQSVSVAHYLPDSAPCPQAPPLWVQARLGDEPCQPHDQNPPRTEDLKMVTALSLLQDTVGSLPEENCMHDKVAHIIGPPSAHTGVVKGGSPVTTDWTPWATWFSPMHVCGSQRFPPLTSTKVQARDAWKTHLSSSSGSSLCESSDMDESSPRELDVQSVSGSGVTLLGSSQVGSDSYDLKVVNPSRTRWFSPDLPPMQSFPSGEATLDTSHKPPRSSLSSSRKQGLLCDSASLGPEQYQIHSDDDDCGLAADAEMHSCWEQSWVDLHEPPSDRSWHHGQGLVTGRWSLETKVNSLPADLGILRRALHKPPAQACRLRAAKVTWHVPLEISSVYYSECRTTKLDPSPGPFFFGRSIVSQVLESGVAFVPNLACTFMRRLLTLRVSQARARGKQFMQPTCSSAISEARCCSPLPSTCGPSGLSAPSQPQSWALLPSQLPGRVSISGDACDNVLALACIQPRWGETSSPETNFQISLCTETWT